MKNYIDSIEEFLQIKDSIKPMYLYSKKLKQNVLVPAINTLLVRTDLVIANSYNPNEVPADKMALLEESVLANGFCFPIVTIYDEEIEKFIIIDGFHRSSIGGADWLDFDYLPIVILQHDVSQRMLATVQFNKARGVHQVDKDADVIRGLIEQGLSKEEIADKLKIELDTIERYMTLSGMYSALYKNSQYSRAWTMVNVD